MFKKSRKTLWPFLLLTFISLVLTGVIFAEASPNIAIGKDVVIPTDKFAFGQIVQNEGTIQGDLFAWAQNVTSSGAVGGDILAGAQDLKVSGPVSGNIRVMGGSVILSGTVAKNVNALGGTITLDRNSAVGGNLLVFGGQVEADGKVQGRTSIWAGKVTLGGEFFGDVEVRTDYEEKNSGERVQTSLTVLPGTIIHGKLTFKGQKADIQPGAQIANFRQVRPNFSPAERHSRELNQTIWKFVRLIFSTAVYFLLALMIYRFFPVFFKRQGELASAKPWGMMGIGAVALLSTIIALIAWIILLVLSVLISPLFGLTFGALGLAAYMTLFFFSTIPVAFWLGGLILGERRNLAYRFGIGLGVYSVGLFILGILAQLPAVGFIFGIAAFLARFGALLIGSGAILAAGFESYRAGKQQAL